eukprot:9892117-Prorocentrum_lima.AAC.1
MRRSCRNGMSLRAWMNSSDLGRHPRSLKYFITEGTAFLVASNPTLSISLALSPSRQWVRIV